MFSILANWGSGIWAGVLRDRGSTARTPVVIWAAVAVNIGLLGYFKYTGFLVSQLNRVGEWLSGASVLPVPDILLPIGVSFFTFQGLSYVLDVARGRVRPVPNLVDFGMYLAMFSQLIAGPIVRVRHIEGQIHYREETWDGVSLGAVRFAHGLAKKVLIADTVAPIADQAFGLGAGVPTGLAWLGLLAFSTQLYFDFSGYSDMAIGMGRMFGFRFPENFNRPLSAVSITDLWQRWHITLTTWFRDYVFLPLSVGRKREVTVYMNLLFTFVLVGFWHGAKWTFIIFGLYHGAWLCWERFRRRSLKCTPRAPEPSLRAWTFLRGILGLVWFRAQDLDHAGSYFQALFGLGVPYAGPAWFGEQISGLNLLALAIGLSSVFLPRNFTFGRFLEGPDRPRIALWRWAVVGLAFCASLVLVIGRQFQPFIYFQF